MSVAQLLEDMAASLSDADLNAIRKAREFSAKETASRNSFTSYFATSIGIPEALQSLTAEENVTLRLIAQTGEVDIPFFERLYGSAAHPDKPYYSGTYTQRYKPTFDAVKRNLVRKGLLVMAETKMRGETVQMERWRFALPPEFAAFLPPLAPSKSSNRPGETSDRTIRKKFSNWWGVDRRSPTIIFPSPSSRAASGWETSSFRQNACAPGRDSPGKKPWTRPNPITKRRLRLPKPLTACSRTWAPANGRRRAEIGRAHV
jgi:hypothetical protein